MKTFGEALLPAEMRSINGGRTVRKEDTDGDGKWDVKTVVNDDGTRAKLVIRTEDGRYKWKINY